MGTYEKSMSESTRTREPKAEAKDWRDGSLPKSTTLILGDNTSHDRTARACLFPTEPLKGFGALKMVILGLPFSAKFVGYKKLGFLISTLTEGNNLVA